MDPLMSTHAAWAELRKLYQARDELTAHAGRVFVHALTKTPRWRADTCRAFAMETKAKLDALDLQVAAMSQRYDELCAAERAAQAA